MCGSNRSRFLGDISKTVHLLKLNFPMLVLLYTLYRPKGFQQLKYSKRQRYTLEQKFEQVSELHNLSQI